MRKVPDDIKSMDERIKRLQKQEVEARKPKKESAFVYASKNGFRVGTELLSGVLVGAAIGYLLDGYFGTRPWLLIVFLFLGGAAGFLNVYRFVKSIGKNKE
ncbi:MAG: AtpZ/AtpI family protein [Alphaproteobacteria bacterium]|nr:AtpZ/AtpI family protein [Alphaproteobacteria bacterium]